MAGQSAVVVVIVRDTRIELVFTARGMKGGLRSLSSFCGHSMRARGIEPLSNAWEAFILPLNYARKTDSLTYKLIPRLVDNIV